MLHGVVDEIVFVVPRQVILHECTLSNHGVVDDDESLRGTDEQDFARIGSKCVVDDVHAGTQPPYLNGASTDGVDYIPPNNTFTFEVNPLSGVRFSDLYDIVVDERERHHGGHGRRLGHGDAGRDCCEWFTNRAGSAIVARLALDIYDIQVRE